MMIEGMLVTLVKGMILFISLITAYCWIIGYLYGGG
jgi:hypothetical protein